MTTTPTPTAAGTILACDPGTHRAGLVWMKTSADPTDKPRLAGWELIQPKGEYIHERIAYVCNEVAQVIAERKPSVFVLERTPGGNLKRNRPADPLGALSLDLQHVARKAGVPVVLYLPSQWRALTTGHGAATKQEAITLLRLKYTTLFQVPGDVANDVLDAAGLALAEWERTRDPRLSAMMDSRTTTTTTTTATAPAVRK